MPDVGTDRRSSIERYARREVRRYEYVLAALGVVLLVKSVVTHATPAFTAGTYAISMVLVALAGASFAVRDRLTGLRVGLDLAFAPALYLAGIGAADYARLLLAVGSLGAAAVTRRARRARDGLFEIGALSIGFLAGQLARDALGVVWRTPEAVAFALFAVVAGYVYARVRAAIDAADHGIAVPGGSRVFGELAAGWVATSVAVATALAVAPRGGAGAVEAVASAAAAVAVALVYARAFALRSQLGRVAARLDRLVIVGDSAEKATATAVDAAVGVGAELRLSFGEVSDVALAALLHDVGKAGMHEYSVEHILETISSARGEPLHAERGYAILERIPEAERVAAVVRAHHEPVVGVRVDRRSRKKREILPHVLNVCVTYAERLAYAGASAYAEREAFKSLKKDAGWELHPRTVRALRSFLERRGVTRLA